ncbi:MAG: hypothetical protein KBS75_09150 [Bacteroidales bacterium]|nr:hypothetical protein [Candidatus Equimonas faecalis]
MDAALAAMPDAEAYARGTRNGQEVPSTDPTYHNNAKYFAEKAESAFPESYATGAVRGDIDQSTQTEEWRQQARQNMGITDPVWGSITGNISSQSDLTEVVSPLINQWDEQWEQGRLNPENGMELASTERVRSRYFELKPNTQYFAHSTVGLHILFFNSNKEYISAIQNVDNAIFITPANTKYARFCESVNSTGTYNHDISINYPSTYTGYYPSALPKEKSHIGGLGNAIGMKGWNQLVKNGNFEKADSWFVNNATLSVSGNVGSVAISGTDGNIAQRITPIVGHKYLISADVKPSDASMQIRMIYDTSGWSVSAYLTGTTEWSKMSAIGVMGSGINYNVFYIRGINGSSFQVKNVNIIDLTSLFGAGNEPASVEDFRAMFPADYYPYCSGAWADLLWENASPTSAFAAQTVSVDWTLYSFVLVIFKSTMTGGGENSHIKPCEYDSYGKLQTIQAYKMVYRNYHIVSAGIHIEDAYAVTAYNSGESKDNSFCVPIKIYGIR